MSDLELLLTLQEHDTAIDLLKRRLGALPERAEAHALNERRRATEASVVELGGQLDALSAQESEVEASLETIEKRIASLDQNLRSPGSASRDAQAIIHEIDQLKEQADALEEQGLELLEQRDGVLAQQTSMRQSLDDIAAAVPGVLAAVQAAEGAGGTELAALEAQRSETAAAVAPTLLATYDRMRGKFDGVAVARVVNGTCSGCHLSLSAADLAHMGKLGPGEHATCEQCGRMLVPTAS